MSRLLLPIWAKSGRQSFREVGAFVPLQVDRQGKVIREVALARFGLPLPEHPGQELEVRVALMRDLCRLVPKAPSSCTVPPDSARCLGSGNGRYREELCKGLAAIRQYLTASQLDASRALLRLGGQYGNGEVLADVVGFAFVTRGKDYHLLTHHSGALALAPRSVPATPRKSDGAQPL